MGKIYFENIAIHACHGHLPEEQKIGSRYRIDLEIDADIEKAAKTDKLDDTFDYRIAYEIITEEMKENSSLLENIACRIMDRIILASKRINSVKIKLAKLNPPFRGDVHAVAVELMRKRKL